MNDNQNNFVREGRTTSRVLAEPGGGSSIQLGWSSPPKEKTDYLSKNRDAAVTQKIGNPGMNISQLQEPKSNVSAHKILESGGTSTSSNAFSCGNQGNVLTERSSTKINQPPGGQSSIQFF
mmetsp:Transcript_38276/g.89025  ORF Transcript_38276/g.89025 Transcript_38276/m.89025 type:complete len:121 (-) Transcript_38276:105-467(-)|eukprot:CAMPEP_0113326190 /NCGR_PEP_ID=MMETSP0010_2-20120614/18342_1 /TAXON_ID=216773 ORGANISM="Corethron hystrix, Strain 308" /NCGR_SAMPLE_ID=MMETSP0010_2 /ASSEMBLY_ACC=CAM_ASM_000155 /LENGTH=120 /DNA_ID=CAMNT_0000186411 /DNA_START=98 /DNA_END=460 /DNA_ORIENTATION=+ /assembly_acc=CAM_ASM_000155